MKQWFKILSCASILAMVGFVSAQNSTAPIAPPQDSYIPALMLKLDWSSKYVRKGRVFNDQPVALGTVELELEGFYVGAWGVYDLTHAHDRNDGSIGDGNYGRYGSERKYRFEEANYYAGYYYTFDDVAGLGPLTLDGSWTYLYYPTAHKLNSKEVSLAISLDEVYKTERQGVAVKLTSTYDYDLEETWLCLGSAYTLALDEEAKWELVLNADLYWGDAAMLRNYVDWNGETEGNAFTNAVLGATLNVKVTDNFVISPYMNLAYALDGRVRDAMRADSYNNREAFWAGIKASVAF